MQSYKNNTLRKALRKALAKRVKKRYSVAYLKTTKGLDTMSNKQTQQKSLLFHVREGSPQWFVFNAEGKTLGRLASEIAKVLRGKHKPTYTPQADIGDGVIVINADKVHVSGRKPATKVYRRYTGHVGGLREIPFRTMQQKNPEFIIETAVYGMLPKTRMGEAMRKRLRVFKGTEHNMQAQKPVEANI